MSSEFRIPLILQIAIFFIPMNIYIIGDWVGAGIQWVFFRYITAMDKTSIILLTREIDLITSGLLTGKSAMVSVIWVVGVILLIAATILVVYGTIETNLGLIKKAAFINIGGGVVFLVSIFIQYGFLLHGPAGTAIPFGIPVLFVIGYLQYRESCKIENDPDYKEEEEVEEETENENIES